MGGQGEGGFGVCVSCLGGWLDGWGREGRGCVYLIVLYAAMWTLFYTTLQHFDPKRTIQYHTTTPQYHIIIIIYFIYLH